MLKNALISNCNVSGVCLRKLSNTDWSLDLLGTQSVCLTGSISLICDIYWSSYRSGGLERGNVALKVIMHELSQDRQ